MDLNKSYIFGIGKHHTSTHHTWFLSKMPFSAYKLLKHYVGDILVSLCYQPAANIVTTVVLKARNLPKMDMNGFSGKCRQLLLNAKLSLQFPAFLFSDPYVKIYMLCNEQRVTKKKTHVKKRTLNPVFNESFVFDLPQHPEGGSGNSIKNISFEFWLFDWDRGTKDEVRN